MRVHTCVNDRVLLTWEGTMAARNANTSRPLAWIRSQQPEYRALGILSGPHSNWFHRVREANGVTQVNLGVRTTIVYVGRELAEYPGAPRMCFNFERGKLDVFENALPQILRELGERLAANPGVARVVNAQSVSDAITPLMPEIGEQIAAKRTGYIRAEIGGLKNALARLDVPREILAT